MIDDDDLSDAQRRARKVKPQYGEGPLVRVAWARHQAEAELIAGLLLEEGIPAVVRRNQGFDVPDLLASGPRDILVAASGADAAREVLADQREEAGPGDAPPARELSTEERVWVRVLAITVAAILVGSSVAGALWALLR
jgi:hypothetical protein